MEGAKSQLRNNFTLGIKIINNNNKLNRECLLFFTKETTQRRFHLN